jgi:hypothetical protein
MYTQKSKNSGPLVEFNMECLQRGSCSTSVSIAEGVKAICVVNFVLGLSVLYSLLAIGKLINDTFTAYIKVQVSMCLCRAKSNRHWSNTNRAVDTPY